MSRTRRIRRRGMAVLAALAAAIAWTGGAAPPAFARSVPPPGAGGTGQGVPPARAHAATVAGMHAWQIGLIAIGAVLAGAVLAVVYDRVRAARQARVTVQATRA